MKQNKQPDFQRPQTNIQRNAKAVATAALLLAVIATGSGCEKSKPRSAGPAKTAIEKKNNIGPGAAYIQAEMEIAAEPMKKPDENAATKCRTLVHGSSRRKLVALTFDDGPHPRFTPRLMKILDHYKIKATFFLVGKMAEKFPQLVKKQAQVGHLLANHSYHHVNVAELDPKKIATEIKATEDIIFGITGRRTRFFRPPGGNYDADVEQVLADRDYTLALWTVNPGDYEKPGRDFIARRIINDTHNGGVILIHDGVEQTIVALPKIIEGLKARGFTFVTIDKLMPGAKTSRANITTTPTNDTREIKTDYSAHQNASNDTNNKQRKTITP